MKNQGYTLIKSHRARIAVTEERLLKELKKYTEGMVYYDDYVDSFLLAITVLPHKPKMHGIVTFGSMLGKDNNHNLWNKKSFTYPSPFGNKRH